jgi:hypothetical protein
MQLEKLTAVVRPRLPWEAVDLGFTMVRHWWLPVFASWFMVALPVALVLNLVFQDRLWLAAFITWWLKPLFDRLPLHIVSRALFGASPSITDTLRALPSLLVTTRLLSTLTLRRFDMARSLNLPVWQLEGLRGAQGRARTRVLRKNTRGIAVGLTLACLHLEFAIYLTLYGLLFLMLPESVELDFISFFDPQTQLRGFAVLSNLFALLAMSIIEPFYVAGGFALYLNRRTHLEGWDIELAFRRLVRRIEQQHAPLTRHLFQRLEQ